MFTFCCCLLVVGLYYVATTNRLTWDLRVSEHQHSLHSSLNITPCRNCEGYRRFRAVFLKLSYTDHQWSSGSFGRKTIADTEQMKNTPIPFCAKTAFVSLNTGIFFLLFTSRRFWWVVRVRADRCEVVHDWWKSEKHCFWGTWYTLLPLSRSIHWRRRHEVTLKRL